MTLWDSIPSNDCTPRNFAKHNMSFSYYIATKYSTLDKPNVKSCIMIAVPHSKCRHSEEPPGDRMLGRPQPSPSPDRLVRPAIQVRYPGSSLRFDVLPAPAPRQGPVPTRSPPHCLSRTLHLGASVCHWHPLQDEKDITPHGSLSM